MLLENVKNNLSDNDSCFPEKEDSHVLNLWQPFDFNINENYKFINNSLLFNIFSDLLYLIAYPILYIFCKIFLGFKAYGKENLKIDSGKITISNHVHFLDCVMLALANIPSKVFFTSLESNFKIPVVRHIIKLLNAIPIPTNIKYTHNFLTALDDLLKNNKTIHFYPEGSLWPYYTGIRHFKSGAFNLAVKNNVPIIPCVYKFEKPTGIYSFFKRKPCISLHILEPIYPNLSLSKTESIETLKNETLETILNFNKKNVE